MTIKIVAEVAQGYEGDEKIVDFFIKAISTSKADAIKFQIFFADELALPDYTYYQLFKNLELPFEFWKKAINKAHEGHLEFYSDIFGRNSLKELLNIGIDGIKIHATDINNFPLLKQAAKAGKKILLATGGCQLKEIETALDIVSRCPVTLMYGFQAEPTEIEDNNLSRIATLKQIYNKPVGFMDHTAGDSPLALHLPFIAIGKGAELVEKHVTLSRQAQMEDYVSALTTEEFKPWCNLIKQTVPSLGEEKWILTPKELEYRKKIKRAVCAEKAIKSGHVIGLEDVTLKRTSDKEAIFDIDEIINKVLKNDLGKNALIRLKDIV